MGMDIAVKLIYGYKIPLSVAFESFLNSEIVNSDDYQLTCEKDCKDEIIENHIKSSALKNILTGTDVGDCGDCGDWNMYILTSSQDDCEPNTSYFYLFNKRQELYSGRAPDYESGKVDMQFQEPGIKTLLTEVPLSNDCKWEYDLHWVVESSW